MRDGFRIIDADLHLQEAPDTWTRYLDSFHDRAPRVVASPEGTHSFFEGQRLPAIDSEHPERFAGIRKMIESRVAFAKARGFDGPSQLQAMDMEGIDIAVLFPTMGMYLMGFERIEPAFAAALCRAYNNWLFDFCRADPSRLKGAALVPPHDVGEAVRETRRAVSELGFVGVFFHPSPHRGRQWHQREWDPLWATLEELEVPACFHDAVGQVIAHPGDQFGKNRQMVHTATHPISMMNASLSLIVGGVLERFPRLRVALLEAYAGWLPYWLDRLDHEHKLLGTWDAPSLTLKPSEYYFRQCFVTAEEGHRLKGVVDQLGADTMVWSCDYPHWNSEFPDAAKELLEQPVSDEAKRKILWDNPRRLYPRIA